LNKIAELLGSSHGNGIARLTLSESATRRSQSIK
jgi:hypothetical protein